MSYKKYAETLIADLGGEENIQDIYHCATRLRVKVKNRSLVDDEDIKRQAETVALVESGGQIQIIIGQFVGDVYREILAQTHLKKKRKINENLDEQNPAATQDEKDKGIFTQLFDVISGVFTPILGLLTATGVIKGLLAFLTTLNLLDATSGTYAVLNIAGDSFFYFMPVFLGYTAMKKFGGTPFLGMALGAAFIHPNVAGILTNENTQTLFTGSLFETAYSTNFMGLPLLFMNYASSVIPIIFTTFFAAKLEKFLDLKINKLVKSFMVPMLVLVIIVPLAFLIIGPLSTLLSSLLGEAAVTIYDLNPVLLGFLYGALIQVCVMFGLHWGFVTIAINNIATMGFDPVTITGLTAGFAQAGAVIMVMKMQKDDKYKKVGIPAVISSLLGITEPAIYGITLPMKKPFILASIASGVGGAIMGAVGAKQFSFGANGIFGFLNVINPEMGWDFSVTGTIIACLVSFAVSIVLMAVFGKGKEDRAVEIPNASQEG